MTDVDTPAPKLFISYSWSSPDHERWVVNVATELRASGVDVILDKWDLREGQDANVFMEKIVADPEIRKVAIISDKVYAEKADGRRGGVGTETQIISKEVYENVDQEKFVVLLTERDEAGNPCVPTYFTSRKYIDFTREEQYAESFEQVVRWAFGKPLYVKPDIGKAPSYLNDQPEVSLGTSHLFMRAENTIRNDRGHQGAALGEYLQLFSDNLERFRIACEGPAEVVTFDDVVVASIDNFLPYRNEFVQLVNVICQYAPSEENAIALHRLFERLIPYMFPKPNTGSHYTHDFDNFKFIIHELFLYTVGMFLKYEKFEQANVFLAQDYYIDPVIRPGGSDMTGYSIFRNYIESFENRKRRLSIGRLSIRADMLHNRCAGLPINFKHLMQADFVAFLRGDIVGQGLRQKWWPETLLYASDSAGAFEIFARSRSRSYFDRVKLLLAIGEPADLINVLQSYRTNPNSLPNWQHETFSPARLLGFDKLATSP